MFPAGAAGCGLVLLRVCAAGMLIRNSIVDATVPIPTWQIASVIIVVIALCLGAFTPVSCCVSAAMQILLALDGRESNPYHIAFTFCVTSSVFFLGPGAFSLDSHLFGRRLIVHSDST